MSYALLEIEYYNTFWNKKANNGMQGYILNAWGGLGSSSVADGYPEDPAMWLGLPWNPSGYLPYPGGKVITSGNNTSWYIEESRIKGGFNNTQNDLGIRAFVVETSDAYLKSESSVIYSGILNKNTGVNQTNVFSVADDITKNFNPQKGSIQKLYSEDTNLLVFQQNKVSKILVNKDQIYTTSAGTQTNPQGVVLGQIIPYGGEYGISNNPESFAYFGYRKYFTDDFRGCVMRLSADGLTEISRYGMSNFFRDKLEDINSQYHACTLTTTLWDSFPDENPRIIRVPSTIADQLEIGTQMEIVGVLSDIILIGKGDTTADGTRILINAIIPPQDLNGETVIFTYYKQDRILGAYDVHNRCYTLSLQKRRCTGSEYNTLTFEDGLDGWVSFYDFTDTNGKPPFEMRSIKGQFYTFKDTEIWQHHINNTHANFYGDQKEGKIKFVLNANPSLSKNFKTINYEGSSGWEVNSLVSDKTGPTTAGVTYTNDGKVVKSYEEGIYTDGGVQYRAGFNRKENKYYANLRSNNVPIPGQVLFGDEAISGVKAFYVTVEMSNDATTDVGGFKELYSVGSEIVRT